MSEPLLLATNAFHRAHGRNVRSVPLDAPGTLPTIMLELTGKFFEEGSRPSATISHSDNVMVEISSPNTYCSTERAPDQQAVAPATKRRREGGDRGFPKATSPNPGEERAREPGQRLRRPPFRESRRSAPRAALRPGARVGRSYRVSAARFHQQAGRPRRRAPSPSERRSVVAELVRRATAVSEFAHSSSAVGRNDEWSARGAGVAEWDGRQARDGVSESLRRGPTVTAGSGTACAQVTRA